MRSKFRFIILSISIPFLLNYAFEWAGGYMFDSGIIIIILIIGIYYILKDLEELKEAKK